MGLDAKGWLAVVGLCVGGFLASLLLFLFIGWAWYAWGFLGMFLFFGLVALGIGWYSDRRAEKQRDEYAV
jgi:hypothetical protein